MTSTSLLAAPECLDPSKQLPTSKEVVEPASDDENVAMGAPSRKRQRLVESNNETDYTADSATRASKLADDSLGLEPLWNGEDPTSSRPKSVARLSKWAARLFDPNRPKGLVQAPITIPLNDEFLQAFGRREKDTRRVMDLDISTAIDSDDDNDNDVETPSAKTPTGGQRTNRKVKITNLKYTTTSTTLQAVCGTFGPIEEAKLLMQADQSKNPGVAYVTFADASSAQACVEGLTSIDQRPVNVSLALPGPSSRSKSASSGASRYYGNARILDLSTKCFQCGKPGHMASACTNAALVKPCPLCARTTHDMRNCPDRNVCFNCGIPGHVSRACPLPRNARPERRFCTVCYTSSTHARSNCRRSSHMMVPPDTDRAICATCGQTGHYLCRKLQWTTNLQGVTCCKCGMPGHIGAHCNRPNMEVCSRNEDVVCIEIESAGTFTSVQERMYTDDRRGNHRQDSQSPRGREHGRGPRHQDDSRRHHGTHAPHERGRAPYRREQPAPIRPYKSMPPPRHGRKH